MACIGYNFAIYFIDLGTKLKAIFSLIEDICRNILSGYFPRIFLNFIVSSEIILITAWSNVKGGQHNLIYGD